MKTKINVDNNGDMCLICPDVFNNLKPCEYRGDIYNCPILNENIEKKTARYKWCWIKNENL